jgi:hypothetical protein
MADTPEDKSEKPEVTPTGWMEGNTTTTPLPPIPVYLSARGMVACTSSVSAVVAWITPLPEDHDFYRNVGRVASEWSHLEHILDLTIWKISGMPENVSACITSQIMGVPGRCHAIMNLARVHGFTEKELQPYKSLKGDSYPVAELRHRIVHDAWYAQMPAGTPMQFKAMPFSDPQHGYKEISQGEVDYAINKIKGLQERAYQQHNDLLARLATLRGSTA